MLNIDWHSLTTLAGSPEEIPLLLDKLSVPDARIWYKAVLRLIDLLLPNDIDYYPAPGTSLPVTTQALLTLLFDTAIASRPRILWLLGDILNLHPVYLREDPSYQAAETLILAEFSRFMPLLASSDRRMRIAAAYVLSTIARREQAHDDRTQIQAALMDRLRIERSRVVTPALIYAVLDAYHGEDPDPLIVMLTRKLETRRDVITRIAAMLGICGLTLDFPAVCMEVLENEYLEIDPLRWLNIYLNMRLDGATRLFDEHFYDWFFPRLVGDTTLIERLFRANAADSDHVFQVLLKFIEHDNEYNIERTTSKIVSHFFQDILPDKWTVYEALNLYQKLIVVSMYGNDRFWNRDYGSLYFFFRDIGLPHDRAWWRKFIYEAKEYRSQA